MSKKESTLPASVKIGPHDIPLVEGPDTMDNFGEYVYDTMTINIRAGMRDSVVADVLIHEILHVIWDSGQLRQFCMGVKDPSVLEETLVSALSPQILQVLRENPEVVKVLLK